MKIDIQRLQKQSGIIGTSEKIIEVLGMIAQVAPVDISVLITGESGTGKEVMARAIHKHSKRSNSLMVTVNCGAIPEGIIESELFGHKKGSFTGASENRKGYFEEANKGTIFLDEIGEAPLETQVKLLRVLETGEYMRVGESKVRYTDVRVLAATNKNLIELVKKNQFRQDLYYRLKTVMVQVPPLRDRVEDINPLVERFALEFTRSNEISYRGFMPDAIRIMKQYNWPGNIRELKNFVEMIMVFEKGERITVDMVNRELNDVLSDSVPDNYHLPIAVNSSSQQAEIDIILRQLFLLRQDTELIRNLLAVDKDNNVLIDFKDNHLHVVNYSISVNKIIKWSDLKNKLYTHDKIDNAIPYRTSYYNRDWGFCLSYDQMKALKKGKYHVVIDSTLKPGVLNYGELLISGKSKKEVFLST